MIFALKLTLVLHSVSDVVHNSDVSCQLGSVLAV